MASGKNIIFFCFVIVLVCLLIFTSCSKEKGQYSIIVIAGSTSVQPIVEYLAEEYMKEEKEVQINVQGGGSSTGIQSAYTGVANIGTSSRELKENERNLNLTEDVIAYDAIALIVHPSNNINNLSVEQIRGIFSGEIKNWKQVGGQDREIHVVTREEGSGTRGAFQEMAMGEQEIYDGAVVQDSNGAIRVVVAGDKKAIGYISLGLVNKEVKAIKIDGIAPTIKNVKERKYKLCRPFLFLTKGKVNKETEKFINFVLSKKAQEMILKEGFINVK